MIRVHRDEEDNQMYRDMPDDMAGDTVTREKKKDVYKMGRNQISG